MDIFSQRERKLTSDLALRDDLWSAVESQIGPVRILKIDLTAKMITFVGSNSAKEQYCMPVAQTFELLEQIASSPGTPGKLLEET